MMLFVFAFTNFSWEDGWQRGIEILILIKLIDHLKPHKYYYLT